MISFKLDPQSGHVDSYLDVKFSVQFETAERVEVRLFNDTINSSIDLLGISNGYIYNENIAVIKNGRSVDGYINIFNKDKLNSGLRDFVGVDIRCEVTRFDGENIISTENDTLTFYNHSQSLDGNIVPFDLVLVNPEVDLKRNIPLQMHIVCDREEKYELCVRSEDGHLECTFEVITKPGTITVSIPSEILWHDLGLQKKLRQKRLDVYWVKFEGISHLKFMNRKYIKIDNTQVTFNSQTMMPQSTTRLGPTGLELPTYFVLSHRYYVHTHKHWSEYGGYIDGYSRKKLINLTRFWHESQNMHLVDEKIIDLFANEKKIKESPTREIRQAMWNQRRSDAQEKAKAIRSTSKEVLNPYATLYTRKTIETMSTDMAFISGPAPSTSTSTSTKKQSKGAKSGGCGCSRKKHG